MPPTGSTDIWILVLPKGRNDESREFELEVRFHYYSEMVGGAVADAMLDDLCVNIVFLAKG